MAQKKSLIKLQLSNQPSVCVCAYQRVTLRFIPANFFLGHCKEVHLLARSSDQRKTKFGWSLGNLCKIHSQITLEKLDKNLFPSWNFGNVPQFPEIFWNSSGSHMTGEYWTPYYGVSVISWLGLNSWSICKGWASCIWFWQTDCDPKMSCWVFLVFLLFMWSKNSTVTEWKELRSLTLPLGRKEWKTVDHKLVDVHWPPKCYSKALKFSSLSFPWFWDNFLNWWKGCLHLLYKICSWS